MFAYALANVLQHQVTGVVPVAVIDWFEMVEIDQQQRQRFT